jgi:branched-chain amino acid transport system permease protein
VSLCQLSLAGIGGVTMAHLGKGGSPMGLVWAAVISGIVGALIALPALRLSGIYLALATAAFAVFMDKWVWGLKEFTLPFNDIKISLFGTGSVSVSRLKLPGFDSGGDGKILGRDLSNADRQLILLATAFALLSILVVAVRRSPFGRRLLAMKDSEAACATVGMNLVLTKMAVFALSASIAGVGGALLAGINQSTSPDNWQFIAGLPIFMIAVVGGVGRVGGALFAGISLQVLNAMPQWPILNSRLLGMNGWFSRWSAIAPGLMGIGLGRNPNGAVTDMRAGFEPIMASKRAIATFVVLVGALYLAVLNTDVLNGWIFILGTITALIVCAQMGKVEGIRRGTLAPDPDPSVEEFGMHLEWVGVDREVTDTDIALLDEKLGLAREVPA